MIQNKIKILLVMPSLHRGGAERVMSILANNLSPKLFDVTLVLLQERGSYLKTLKNDIRLINLNTDKVSKSFIPLRKLIIKENPDIVFSALGHLNLLLSVIKKSINVKTKFIARETNIPSIINKTEKFPFLFNYLYKQLYSSFDKIICQSTDMANDLIENYDINSKIIKIINNPVNIELIHSRLNNNNVLPTKKINFVAIGSFEYRKGFDLLLNSWHMLKDKKNKYLTIIGEGNLKKELQQLIKKYNLEDSVSLLDFQENPYLYMKNADYFILSSRFEGFPNVLLEALSCGTPAIAFNCPGGIDEIIFHGKNGWIVNKEDIVELSKVIDKEKELKFTKEEIINNIRERYSLEYILNRYTKLFQNILDDKPSYKEQIK